MEFFEDVVVGSKRRFGQYEVTREDVLQFATKFDPQPFHLDDEAAAGSMFGNLAASGWHTCAMTMRMMVDSLKDQPRASLGGAGIDELRWVKPVYPGDVLRCETEILDKRRSRSKPHMGIMRQRTSTFNQHDELVLTMITNIIIKTRIAND